MGQPFRLPSGGRIDRAAPLTFSFNGKRIDGFAGDSVASALLANGVRLVGRSFKYHRPRGLLSHGSDEPNALIGVDRGSGRIDPNNRTTMVEALDGLRTASQNHWPSLDFDLGAINDRLSPIFAAGFYYKTFMWPRSFWERVYEPLIRAAAGLGVAPADPDPDRYAHRYSHCDTLVVGAGPAGLAAALAAAEAGGRVILADEQAELGGSLLHDRHADLEEICASLRARDNITVLPRTTAFGLYNHNFVGLVERATDHLAAPPAGLPRERLWKVRAKEIVLATGAHERPLTFGNNDRPGVMLAESIRAYVNRYAVTPGRRIILATNGPSAYRAAMDLHSAGLGVVIVDSRSEGDVGEEFATARAAGIEILSRHVALRAEGRKSVSALVVAPIGDTDRVRRLDCDCVGMSGGWTPAVHLFSQSRGRLAFSTELDAFIPDVPSGAIRCVGAANGDYDFAGTRTFAAAAVSAGKAFVDFQHDVTAKDVQLAVREGFESVEHIKRYTTTGMATDQGKTSNMAALAIASEALARPIHELGTTTFRPPYTPVSFGALIGIGRDRLFDPIRRPPMHDWAAERGAVFENVGLWKRARYYPQPGETMDEAVRRECRAVRNAVGIFDASTLGKIEVVGPDAAKFLNRIYINAWSKLEPGRCRYGVMLKEDGHILDDGVVARLSADRFHVTTTTGGAQTVLSHMEEYLQTEWPDLDVFCTSTTEQWAVIALQGPRAREVLAQLPSDIDLASDAFPHMSIRTGHICGVPTRLFRVSFTGELGFEINVPAGRARTVWEALHAHGESLGLAPYGTEATHVLRAERGFIIIGQETDGTVTPGDVGLAGMIARAKADFVGKRSLDRPDIVAPDRKQLVGLLTELPDSVLDEGAQLIDRAHPSVPAKALGHVTSSYWSPACGRSIALALIAGGRARLGETLYATTARAPVTVRVVEPVFFDPEGGRVNG
jgi:sarcosine oxidase subunit alpha